MSTDNTGGIAKIWIFDPEHLGRIIYNKEPGMALPDFSPEISFTEIEFIQDTGKLSTKLTPGPQGGRYNTELSCIIKGDIPTSLAQVVNNNNRKVAAIALDYNGYYRLVAHHQEGLIFRSNQDPGTDFADRSSTRVYMSGDFSRPVYFISNPFASS